VTMEELTTLIAEQRRTNELIERLIDTLSGAQVQPAINVFSYRERCQAALDTVATRERKRREKIARG